MVIDFLSNNNYPTFSFDNLYLAYCWEFTTVTVALGFVYAIVPYIIIYIAYKFAFAAWSEGT